MTRPNTPDHCPHDNVTDDGEECLDCGSLLIGDEDRPAVCTEANGCRNTDHYAGCPDIRAEARRRSVEARQPVDTTGTVECDCGGGLVYTENRERNLDHVRTEQHTRWIVDGPGRRAAALRTPKDADGDDLVAGKAYRVTVRTNDRYPSYTKLLVFSYVHVEDDNSRTFVWQDEAGYAGLSESTLVRVQPIPAPDSLICELPGVPRDPIDEVEAYRG